MEELRWFLGGLLELVRAYVLGWARAGEVVGEEFGWALPPVVAQLIGVLFGVAILVAFMNRVFKWAPKGNQPQAFPLKTAETPAQIMSKDRDGFLGLLVKIVFLGVVLALIISVRQ